MIIKYIKASVEIIYNLKLEEAKKNRIKDCVSSYPLSMSYEEIIRQFEQETRDHISVSIYFYLIRLSNS